MTVNYYDATNAVAGTECSSTGEGRHLTFEESVLSHPYHADGLVDGKDPVCVGQIVGVAFSSASDDTDAIAIYTEGVWYLNVSGTGAAIAVGDPLFIDDTLGVIGTDNTDVPFGYALGTVTSATGDVIAVKVHGSVV